MRQYQQMQPGENPAPCEGSDCPQMPLPPPGSMTPGQEFAPGTGPNMPPAEGMNPMAPPSGENVPPPPPSTAPGGGGNLPPGEPVPLAPPTEQTPPAEAPAPPPSESAPPPTSFIINTDSLVGSLIYAAFRALVSY